ncbi:enolase-phosphatase E1 [Tieghemiomyces parasiticus]|uniref:Enolase-phosphatase E1 n=1 Tax=Tieghemiomyces parasiticus TaxID=78921 RepID=A0A9W8AH65_9FUNG|nr:enolase-phosphatase E1 [Tieghemiomyces parasiticus]
MTDPSKLAYAAVLLDIEGTTTPISFVHEVLFPYVQNHARAFIEARWDDPACRPYLTNLQAQSEADRHQGLQDIPRVADLDDATLPTSTKINSLVANLDYQIYHDRKIKALKDFQGYMWEVGYRSGELKSIVYPDVVDALKQWKSLGKPVYIYSSGSVPAQKLIFAYSDQGDLTPYLAGYYDTAVGSKLATDSYRAIQQTTGVPARELLFISDNVKEIDAARAAGFPTAVAQRPGNAPLPAAVTADPIYTVISDFHALLD